MHLIGEVVVKRPDRGDLSGPGCGVQAVAGIPAVLVLDPVPAEVRHVAVNVRQGHGGHEVQIHVHNADLIQRPVTQGWVPGLLEIAEEIPQVQKVFVHGPLGVGFDGLVVREKVPQNLRRFGAVISHNGVNLRADTPRSRRSGCRGGRSCRGPETGPGAVWLSPKLNKIFILFNFLSPRKTSFPDRSFENFPAGPQPQRRRHTPERAAHLRTGHKNRRFRQS